MNIKIEEITDRNDKMIAELTAIWRESVTATHGFLKSNEIDEIEQAVPLLLRSVPTLAVIFRDDIPVGFAGTAGNRLEMLFLSPSSIGQGLGKALLHHCIEKHDTDELTVNEDNQNAVGFYRHMGFSEYRRSDTDEDGRPFPIIYMKRGR